jgi:hypothetical protein
VFRERAESTFKRRIEFLRCCIRFGCWAENDAGSNILCGCGFMSDDAAAKNQVGLTHGEPFCAVVRKFIADFEDEAV